MEMKQSARILAAAILAASTLSMGCGGEGGEEAIFLYIINGYPGTATLDLIGPRGTVATGVKFGDRMASQGVCAPGESCVPIRFDRELGSDMTAILENTPEELGLEKELYSMYPHETGTLVINRKGSEAALQSTLLRHIQTISSDCSLWMFNGLSLNNQYLPEGNNYSIAPEFLLEPLQGGFIDETQEPFVTECGELPTNEADHGQLMRTPLLDLVASNPWFFPVECEDQNNRDVACFGWGVPGVDGRSRVYENGQIVSVLDSDEYYECIEAAITIDQPEDENMMALPFPDADAQVECPDRPIEWGDVTVDQQAVEDCRENTIKNVDTLEPGSEDSLVIYQGAGFCDVTFRVRNEGQDIVFGPEDGDDLGKHQDGALIESEISVPDGSQHFWVLLGRPVNPILWQWDSADTFVDLGSFPYFNDQNDRVGDYDSR